jgi:ABC-type uncharacterized transport system involved in gliding motility auxiliary subunit
MQNFDKIWEQVKLEIAQRVSEASYETWIRDLEAIGFREGAAVIYTSSSYHRDIIKNRFNYQDGMGYPLGYDFYTETMYANKELLLNCIDYLVGDEGSIASRSRDIKIRKLNVMKMKEDRLGYQLLNILLPSGIIIIAGIVIVILRRRKYRKHIAQQ